MILTVLSILGIWLAMFLLFLFAWIFVHAIRPRPVPHDQPEREVTR